MTQQEHQERHKLLHSHLDELFADFIKNNKVDGMYSQRPIAELLKWSYRQFEKTDHEP